MKQKINCKQWCSDNVSDYFTHRNERSKSIPSSITDVISHIRPFHNTLFRILLVRPETTVFQGGVPIVDFDTERVTSYEMVIPISSASDISRISEKTPTTAIPLIVHSSCIISFSGLTALARILSKMLIKKGRSVNPSPCRLMRLRVKPSHRTQNSPRCYLHLPSILPPASECIALRRKEDEREELQRQHRFQIPRSE